MKKILIIHLSQGNESENVRFLDNDIEVLRIGCNGDTDKAQELIAEYDGQVDAIGLEGMPALLELGSARREHVDGRTLAESAKTTPVVDGRGIRAGLLNRPHELVPQRHGLFLGQVPGKVQIGATDTAGRHLY